MRALCESCARPQPVDWKPGEQCIHCGAAVRRDVRCFWCAKGTPAGKFCRACGADLVDEPLYPAARMLKDAGTDRFTIPKLLKEFDAERVEHFTRLYQRHAAAAARHVDDLRFLERFLFHKTYSDALEDELVPRLPFPEAELKSLALEPLPPADDLAVAKRIQETSPFPRTRALAALARLRLDDWEASREAAGTMHDPALAPEAALVFSSWRILAAGASPYARDKRVIELLKASPFKPEAAVRLGLMGVGDADRLKAALDSKDAETAFAAALALGDLDRLSAAVGRGEPLMTLAAGRALARQGCFRPLEPVLRSAPLDVQADVIRELSTQKKPAPELREVLLDLVENVRWESPEDVRQKRFVESDRVRSDLRKRATTVLARGCDAALARRLAVASDGDSQFVQPLLAEWGGAPPEAVEPVLEHLISIGKFQASQWNLDDAVKRGGVSSGFVPARWTNASPEMREELLGLAEKQLKQGEDEAVLRFVVNVVFGPDGGKLRARAWWAIERTRDGNARRDGSLLGLREGPIRRFFGSAEAFEPKLVAVLNDDIALKEVGLYDFVSNFLKPADPAFTSAIASAELTRALLRVAGGDYHSFLVDAAIQLLAHVGIDPRWRGEAIEGLRALGKKGNYHYDRALRRLELSVHGMPGEQEWKGLGWRFAPDRFDGVSHEGRLELLKLVDQQRIHEKEETEPLSDWLIDVVFGGAEPDVRRRAMEIYEDRAPRGHADGLLQKGRCLDGLAAAFLAPTILDDRNVADFIEGQFRKDGVLPEHGKGLIEALLRAVGRPQEVPDRLRRAAVDFLEKQAAAPAWRDVVAAGLAGLAEGSHDLAERCGRLAKRLKPPPPPPDAQEDDGDEAAPAKPPASVQDYAEKAKIAEQLGRELQEQCLLISFGAGSPQEKTAEIMKLQDAFQKRIKELYGA
jgi:hypothetical protein